MKRTLVFILIIPLFLLSSCFQIEQNNPFDPNADLPESEKAVTIKGTVYRGWSDIEISGVKVTIGDQTTYSDNNGYYELALMPGNYNLKASKNGWMTEEYRISVNASTNSTQHEDISMFIFYEYWGYPFNQKPEKPWIVEEIISDENQIAKAVVLDTGGDNAALFMEINDNNAGTSTVDVWTDGYSDINPAPDDVMVVLIGIELHSGFANTICGFKLKNAEEPLPFFELRFSLTGRYFYNTPYSSWTDTGMIPAANTVYNVRVVVSVDRTTGYLTFYNSDYSEIMTLLITFTSGQPIGVMDEIIFYVDGGGGYNPAQGSMSIHFLEVF